MRLFSVGSARKSALCVQPPWLKYCAPRVRSAWGLMAQKKASPTVVPRRGALPRLRRPHAPPPEPPSLSLRHAPPILRPAARVEARRPEGQVGGGGGGPEEGAPRGRLPP